MATATTLKRSIRFRDLALFYIVSGLSVRWIASAAAAGPSVLVVWIAALTCFFLPLAASVMELSSRMPDEGGIYIWTREAFGDSSAFIAGWTYWMSNLPYFPSVLYFGAASILFAFGPQAHTLASNPYYFIAFAVGWLAIITLLNIRGVDSGKWLNNICSLGVFLPLAILLVLAAVSFMRNGPAVHYTAQDFVPHLSLDNAVFWSTVFFAFGGVEAGSSMGSEIENPRRIIPWAILTGGAVLALGYIGGTSALLTALPPAAVEGPDGFINGVRALGGRVGMQWPVTLAALFLGINAVGGAASYLSSTSRLPFVAGIDRYLPAAFGKIHPRFRTPWIAIAVYGFAGMLVAFLGQVGTSVRSAYDALVSMAIIAYFLPYLFVFAALIRMQSRAAGPEVRRIPGGKPAAIALACVGFASTTATILLSMVPAHDEPNKPLAVAKVLGGSIILVGTGFLIFYIEKRKRRRIVPGAPS